MGYTATVRVVRGSGGIFSIQLWSSFSSSYLLHYRTLCEGLLVVFIVCSCVLLNTPGQ